MARSARNELKKPLPAAGRIDVIPGIRVLAIGLIAWFHIWQQSWLTPYIHLGARTIDLAALPRAGYIWVDMFIFLSAFQLALPYMSRHIDSRPLPGIADFYRRRALRILPSYLLSVIVCFIIALALRQYPNGLAAAKDLFAQLTFTQTFNIYTYMGTNINVVLWTVAILVQFYLLFPFIVRLFVKKPIAAVAVMIAAATLYRVLFVNSNPNPGMYVNQLPAFLDVLAAGILAAYAYEAVSRKEGVGKYHFVFTIVSIGSLAVIYLLMKDLSGLYGVENLQHWQGINRPWVALSFAVFVFSTALASKWWRFLFSNKIMVFLASVSYNYYIWHQYIAVKLKLLRFPPSSAELPNQAGEQPWQSLYTLCAFLIPVLVAWLITWLYEGKLIPLLFAGNRKLPENQAPDKQ